MTMIQKCIDCKYNLINCNEEPCFSCKIIIKFSKFEKIKVVDEIEFKADDETENDDLPLNPNLNFY